MSIVSLNIVFCKMYVGYQYSSTEDEINHLMLMDVIKLVTEGESGHHSFNQTVRVTIADLGMNFGFENVQCLL